MKLIWISNWGGTILYTEFFSVKNSTPGGGGVGGTILYMIQTEHKLFGYPFSRRSSTTNTRCWTQSFRGHLLHHCAIGDASKLDWHIIWLALFLLQLWFLLFYLLGHLSSLDKTVLVELLTWAGIRHICLCVVKFGSPHALARNTPCLLKNIYQ